MSTTTTVPLTPGSPPQPIQVAGNTPAGFALLNTDATATVTIRAGAAGPVLAALQPGGSLVWRDSAVYPYASTTGAMTLIVTDQASDYSNPAAVAAVTAAQLALQGVPNTTLDVGFGSWELVAFPPSWQRGGNFNPVTVSVGQAASLLLSTSWGLPAAGKSAGPGVLQLLFTDPLVPTMPAQYLHLTADPAADAGQGYAWQIPVLAPLLQVINLETPDANDAHAFVQLAGSNRLVSKVRQVGGTDDTLPHVLATSGSFPAGTYKLTSQAGKPNQTRFNGPVMLTLRTPASSSGWIAPQWVESDGTRGQQAIYLTGAENTITYSHPPVPVSWYWIPAAATSGAVSITLSPQ